MGALRPSSVTTPALKQIFATLNSVCRATDSSPVTDSDVYPPSCSASLPQGFQQRFTGSGRFPQCQFPLCGLTRASPDSGLLQVSGAPACCHCHCLHTECCQLWGELCYDPAGFHELWEAPAGWAGEQGARAAEGLQEEPPPTWPWGPEVLAAPPPHRLQAGRDQISLFNVSLQLHEAQGQGWCPGPGMVPSPGLSTEALPEGLCVPRP